MTIRFAMVAALLLSLTSCEDNPFGTLEAKYIDTTAPPVPEPPQVPDASPPTPTPPIPEPIIDEDGDGVVAGFDCNDDDSNIRPGATEICNGFDDDCDGNTDGDATDRVTIYFDADGDGYGFDDPNATSSMCSTNAPLPPGYVLNKDDCNDDDSDLWKVQPEVCDGLDNDCDGDVDESEPDINLCDDENPYTSDTCNALADDCVHGMAQVRFSCELPEELPVDFMLLGLTHDDVVCGSSAFFESADGEYGKEIVQAQGDVLVLTLQDVCVALEDGSRLHTNTYVMYPADPFAVWIGGEYTTVSVDGQNLDGSPGTVTFFPGGLDFVYETEGFGEACL